MNERNPETPAAVERELDLPQQARDVAIAGRACLVILLLGVVVLLVLCVGVAGRWATT